MCSNGVRDGSGSEEGVTAMTRRSRRTSVLLAAGALAAGCTAADAAPESTPEVAVLRADASVHEPVWSEEAHALLALSEEEPRIVKVDPTVSGGRLTARTTSSPRYPGMGENLATGATGKGVVYLPRPGAGRVTVVDTGTLRRTGSLYAGPAPSYVSHDAGADVLLALSEDGATLTGVDLQPQPEGAPHVVTRKQVRLSPLGEVDGPDRGHLVEYYTVGPERITHYKGGANEVEKTDDIAFRAETTVDDLLKVTRLYAAEKGTDRLAAIDVKPGGEELHRVAESRLGAPVRHLGVDRDRLYAATATTLVVLATDSYEGYPDGRFSEVKTIDFRAALERAELRTAPLSGLAVGAERVYLTLGGVPYVLSIAKPSL